MTPEEVCEKVNAWQEDPATHDLTCLKSSHGALRPQIVAGTVVLVCSDCNYRQYHVPEVVLGRSR